MSPELPQIPRNALERHFQSFLVVLIAGLVGWVGVSVSNTLQATTRLEVKLDNVEEKVEKMEASLNDYPSLGSFRTLEGRIDDHENRLRDLEKNRLRNGL